MPIKTSKTAPAAERPIPKRDYPYIKTPPPGPKAQALIARERKYSSPSYIKAYPLAVAKGRGAMVEDVDGNRYLDFMAGIAVNSTGHSHPKVVEAIQKASEDFLHVCGTDFYYEGMAKLCERLALITPGPSKKSVFLTNSGTEAVDGAIKLARSHTGRPNIIAFNGAFHGRTYGAISVTNSKAVQREGFGPFLPGVTHIPYGNCYRCEYGMTYPGCKLHCVDVLEEKYFKMTMSPKEVAAVIIEPVLGEGGYVMPPAGYLKQWRELCDRHDILLIFDEIQSGIGRTGKWFAADHSGVEPDVVLVAKGLASGMPIGAIIAKDKVMSWPSGSHGSTFGGNPVCCAAALATLDIIEKELMDNARVMGERLLAGAQKLMEKHASIGDVRGLGLMVGVEFVKDRITREPDHDLMVKLEELAFTKGLLLLGCGQSVIRLAPPLVVDEVDVDTCMRIMDECLTELGK